MKTQEAIDHFGGVRQLAEALGISTQAVYDWGERPPIMRQLQIEYLTDGALVSDPIMQEEVYG